MLTTEPVILPRTGIEFITWTHRGAGEDPDSTIEVSLDGGVTWRPVEVMSPTEVRLLVAGPDAVDPPAHAVVLATGRHPCVLRLTDHPEVILEAAGRITVKDTGY